MPPPSYEAGPSHTAGPSYQSGTSYPTYHLPAIPYSYPCIQDGVVGSRNIPLNPTPCQQYFPLPEGMLDHEMGTFYTREVQDAYMAASSWSAFGTDQASQLDALRQAFGGMSVGGTRSRTRTQSRSVRPSESQSVRGGTAREESQGSKRTRPDG